jgi:hypothetical protein
MSPDASPQNGLVLDRFVVKIELRCNGVQSRLHDGMQFAEVHRPWKSDQSAGLGCVWQTHLHRISAYCATKRGGL